MSVTFFTLVLTATTAFAQDCDHDKCYENIKNKLQQLTDSYANRSIPVTNIPSDLDETNLLIQRFEDLSRKIRNKSDISDKLQLINETIIDVELELTDVKKRLQFLKSLKKKFDLMMEKSRFHNETLEQCSNASDKSSALQNDLDNIEAMGKTLIQQLEKMNKTTEDSKKIKKECDDIWVPDSVLCNSALYTDLENIVKKMKHTSIILKELTDTILNKTKENIETNKKILEEVKALDTNLPVLPIQTTEETKPLLDYLRKQLDHLKTLPIKGLNGDILKQAEIKYRGLLEEFKKILETIKSNKDNVIKEMAKAKKLFKLVENKKKMKAALEDQRERVIYLLKGKVCEQLDRSDLEPSI